MPAHGLDDSDACVLGRVLRRIRHLVRAGLYVMTVHGQEEMDSRRHNVLRLTRPCESGDDGITVVVKIGPNGKLVIITVYRSPTGDES